MMDTTTTTTMAVMVVTAVTMVTSMVMAIDMVMVDMGTVDMGMVDITMEVATMATVRWRRPSTTKMVIRQDLSATSVKKEGFMRASDER